MKIKKALEDFFCAKARSTPREENSMLMRSKRWKNYILTIWVRRASPGNRACANNRLQVNVRFICCVYLINRGWFSENHNKKAAIGFSEKESRLTLITGIPEVTIFNSQWCCLFRHRNEASHQEWIWSTWDDVEWKHSRRCISVDM